MSNQGPSEFDDWDGTDPAQVSSAAEDLVGGYDIRDLLHQILSRCVDLVGGDAGSISVVDEDAGTYRKEVDLGGHCQPGRVYPLTSGMTGAVVRNHASTWFRDYGDVPGGGHIVQEDRARVKAVIGIPLEWRGRIQGVCVILSHDADREFGEADARTLESFAKHAAIALANARLYENAGRLAQQRAATKARSLAFASVRTRFRAGLSDLADRLADIEAHAQGESANEFAGLLGDVKRSLSALEQSMRQALTISEPATAVRNDLAEALNAEIVWAERIRGVDTSMSVSGRPRKVDSLLMQKLVQVTQDAVDAVLANPGTRTLRLGIAFDSTTVTLIFDDDGRRHLGERYDDDGYRLIAERAFRAGGTADVHAVRGWGTSLTVTHPYEAEARWGITIEVLIAAPDPITTAGIGRLLTSVDPSISVLKETSSIEDTLTAFERHDPDIVILSGEFPMSALERLSAAGAESVVLCPPNDPLFVDDALRAGARCCVERTADADALVTAVSAATRSRTVIPARDVWAAAGGVDELSAREREVRMLVERGMTDKAIAARLGLSVKTVEKHVGAVLRKAGVRSRVEILALSLRERRR